MNVVIIVVVILFTVLNRHRHHHYQNNVELSNRSPISKVLITNVLPPLLWFTVYIHECVTCDDDADADGVYFVAVFDIGQYIFYFFREIALETGPYSDKTYYSRVGRVCKVFVWFCPASCFNPLEDIGANLLVTFCHPGLTYIFNF